MLSIKLIELAPAGASAKEIVLIAGPLTIATSIAVAALSWRFLERPILEWRSTGSGFLCRIAVWQREA